ncbi:MAG: hypothetical protein HUJ51_06440 [Eggerthellaceae bacterium]|nr:hypothetical protein [Eggerthellaceae bacterium]
MKFFNICPYLAAPVFGVAMALKEEMQMATELSMPLSKGSRLV